MYKLLIFFLLCSFGVLAQEPVYNQMKSNYQFRGVRVDSLLLFPKYADTSGANGSIHGSIIRVGTTIFIRDTVTKKWLPIQGGGVDTISLSNRINSKADTSLLNGLISFSDTLTTIATKSDLGGSYDLQAVTDNGATTTNNIQFLSDGDLIMDTFSSVLFANNSRVQEGYIDAWYGGNHGVALVCGLGYELKWEGGRLFIMDNNGYYIREARYMFTDVPDSSRDLTKGYLVGSRWVLDNGDTYICSDNTINSAIWDLQTTTFDTTSLSNRINDKIDSLRRIGIQVSFKKNGTWYNAYTDSVGSTNGFVPYTGATQDVDLGNNGLDARFLKITGTAGTGHIDLKHQSGDATGQANSTKLYANSSGYLKWKNDNLYYSTLAMPQTANRVYTFQNKSYTLADSAVVDSKLDTSKINLSDNAIPYNDVDTLKDSYLVQDGDVLKSVYGGNDVGLKLDFNNNQYSLGTSSRAINVFEDSIKANLNTGLQSDSTVTITNSGQLRKTQPINQTWYLKDTLPIATFTVGSGSAGDTASFSTSMIAGSFYNDGSDTLFITSYRVAVQGTSASVTPDVWFNDSLNVTAGGTKLVNSPSAITNTTTGTSVTPNTNKIPQGNWVFVKFGTVTTKPTYFTLTLFGYRIRK